MATTVANIITRVRATLIDVVEDAYRWTDGEFIAWCDDAKREIIRRRPDAFNGTMGTDGVTIPAIAEITLATDSLEMNAAWNAAVVDYVLARAFEKDSGDANNAGRAKMHYDRFQVALTGK